MKKIISGESSCSYVIAEIILVAQLQIGDFGKKRVEHATGHGYRIIPPRASTIVRWIAGSGKLRKTLCVRNGEDSKGEKKQEREKEQ